MFGAFRALLARASAPVRVVVAHAILKKYLSAYLDFELTRDQLKVNAWDALALELAGLTLNVNHLNESLAAAGIALSIQSGTIGSLGVTVPWRLWEESCIVRIDRVRLTIETEARTQSYAESQHGGKASNGGSAAAGNPPWSKTDDELNTLPESMHSLAASLSADDFEMIGMAGGSGGNVPDAAALAGLGRDLWGGIDDANLAAGIPSSGGGDSDEFVSVEVLESMIGSVVSLVVVHVTDLQIRLEHFSATTGRAHTFVLQGDVLYRPDLGPDPEHNPVPRTPLDFSNVVEVKRWSLYLEDGLLDDWDACGEPTGELLARGGGRNESTTMSVTLEHWVLTAVHTTLMKARLSLTPEHVCLLREVASSFGSSAEAGMADAGMADAADAADAAADRAATGPRFSFDIIDLELRLPYGDLPTDGRDRDVLASVEEATPGAGVDVSNYTMRSSVFHSTYSTHDSQRLPPDSMLSATLLVSAGEGGPLTPANLPASPPPTTATSRSFGGGNASSVLHSSLFASAEGPPDLMASSVMDSAMFFSGATSPLAGGESSMMRSSMFASAVASPSSQDAAAPAPWERDSTAVSGGDQVDDAPAFALPRPSVSTTHGTSHARTSPTDGALPPREFLPYFAIRLSLASNDALIAITKLTVSDNTDADTEDFLYSPIDLTPKPLVSIQPGANGATEVVLGHTPFLRLNPLSLQRLSNFVVAASTSIADDHSGAEGTATVAGGAEDGGGAPVRIRGDRLKVRLVFPEGSGAGGLHSETLDLWMTGLSATLSTAGKVSLCVEPASLKAILNRASVGSEETLCSLSAKDGRLAVSITVRDLPRALRDGAAAVGSVDRAAPVLGTALVAVTASVPLLRAYLPKPSFDLLVERVGAFAALLIDPQAPIVGSGLGVTNFALCVDLDSTELVLVSSSPGDEPRTGRDSPSPNSPASSSRLSPDFRRAGHATGDIGGGGGTGGAAMVEHVIGLEHATVLVASAPMGRIATSVRVTAGGARCSTNGTTVLHALDDTTQALVVDSDTAYAADGVTPISSALAIDLFGVRVVLPSLDPFTSLISFFSSPPGDAGGDGASNDDGGAAAYDDWSIAFRAHDSEVEYATTRVDGRLILLSSLFSVIYGPDRVARGSSTSLSIDVLAPSLLLAPGGIDTFVSEDRTRALVTSLERFPVEVSGATLPALGAASLRYTRAFRVLSQLGFVQVARAEALSLSFAWSEDTLPRSVTTLSDRGLYIGLCRDSLDELYVLVSDMAVAFGGGGSPEKGPVDGTASVASDRSTASSGPARIDPTYVVVSDGSGSGGRGDDPDGSNARIGRVRFASTVDVLTDGARNDADQRWASYDSETDDGAADAGGDDLVIVENFFSRGLLRPMHRVRRPPTFRLDIPRRQPAPRRRSAGSSSIKAPAVDANRVYRLEGDLGRDGYLVQAFDGTTRLSPKPLPIDNGFWASRRQRRRGGSGSSSGGGGSGGGGSGEAVSCVTRFRVVDWSLRLDLFEGWHWPYVAQAKAARDPRSTVTSFPRRQWRTPIVLAVRGANLTADTFPDDHEVERTTFASVRRVEVVDFHGGSRYKHVLRGKDAPAYHEQGYRMISLSTETLRAKIPTIRGRIRLLPMRVRLDQDALMFVLDFFAPLLAGGDGGSGSGSGGGDPSGDALPGQAIQSFEIAGIEWDIDWKPRHVDLASLRAGSPAELLNLIPLQGVRFRLPPLKVYNLADWGEVADAIVANLVRHQKTALAGGYVSGVRPLRGLYDVGSGVADLFLLPVQQYKKDGHAVKGLQKASSSLLKTTSKEARALANQLAVWTMKALRKLAPTDDVDDGTSGGGSGGVGGDNRAGPSGADALLQSIHESQGMVLDEGGAEGEADPSTASFVWRLVKNVPVVVIKSGSDLVDGMLAPIGDGSTTRSDGQRQRRKRR